MALHKTSILKTSRGFTLLEVVITLAIFSVIAGFGLFITESAFRQSSFAADRDLLVALLQHARAQAIANVCGGTCTGNDGLPHGVHIDSAGHTLTAFQGSSYNSGDTQNQVFTQNPNTVETGATDIIFAQRTGAVTSQQIVTVTAIGRTSVITIEPNGRVWWTN
jgi:prepilin-type N-terminal cleavage/methylation domain-containing protein